MADLLSLSGVYRIEEDPQIPGSEEMTWPYEYRVEVTRDQEDSDLYNIANDVTSGGQYLENFIQIRDNKDGTYNLTYDEYGDGNYQSVDNIEEDVLMNHLNHLVNMDAAIKVAELPVEESSKTEEAEETLEESRYSTETERVANELVKMAKKDGKALSMKDAKEVVDQSYNPKAGTVEEFYKALDLEECVSHKYSQVLKESNSNMGKVYIDSIYMGDDFNGDLTEEDITALTNEFVLDEYPELKISGMTREPSGDWTLILEGPVDAINTWESDAKAKGIDYFISLNESKLSDKVLDYIESTYDKAIAQNRKGMTEDNDSEADQTYICAHCGKKVVNGKGHAEDCWTQELKEDASKEDIDSITKEIVGIMTDEELTRDDIFNKIAESNISDRISLKRALELVDELDIKQKELFESKKEKPARKRKRAC